MSRVLIDTLDTGHDTQSYAEIVIFLGFLEKQCVLSQEKHTFIISFVHAFMDIFGYECIDSFSMRQLCLNRWHSTVAILFFMILTTLGRTRIYKQGTLCMYVVHTFISTHLLHFDLDLCLNVQG